MTIDRTLKYFLLFAGFGISALALFIGVYGACSWGGCGKGVNYALAILAILLIVSFISFCIWIWKVIKVTFGKKDQEESLGIDSSKNKRDILLSVLSILIILGSVYNFYQFINYEILRFNALGYLKYPRLLFGSSLAVLAIIGAVGIWLHRRWGAFVIILIFVITYTPQIIPFISRLPNWNAVVVFGFITGIVTTVILSVKFKSMK